MKLREIAQKQSDIKVTAKLPDIKARLEKKTRSGLKKLAAEDAVYRSWLGERMVSQDQRIKQLQAERAAATVEHSKQLKAREAELAQRHKGPGALHSKSESQIPTKPKGSLYHTEEELAAYRERWKNPIWDRSLEERADAEKHYWQWSRQLKDNAVCVVDHIFTGERRSDSDVQRALMESRKVEQKYWKWAGELNGKQKCAIDQSWTV